MSKRAAFDWRKKFVRQHGRAPGEALPSLREMRGILRETGPEAPTATAERGPSQPAPAKASDLPGGEASPGGATVNPSGPAEIIREEGESGAPQIPLDIELPAEWAVQLERLAAAAGQRPCDCARSLLIELLRDDLLAHEAAGETAHVADLDRLADDGCPHAELRMVQIEPGQFVNERSARALGLVPPTSAMGRLVQGKPA